MIRKQNNPIGTLSNQASSIKTTNPLAMSQEEIKEQSLEEQKADSEVAAPETSGQQAIEVEQ